MSTVFRCRVCGMAFAAETGAAAHMLEAHVERLKDKEMSVAAVTATLQQRFEDAEVIVHDGEVWHHAEYLLAVRRDGTTVHQLLGAAMPGDDRVPTLPDAIRQIQAKFDQAAALTAAGRAAGLPDFRCTGFEYGYSDGEHRYTFQFTADGVEREVTWVPTGGRSQADFLDRLRLYTARVLTGTVAEETDYIACVTVDGIPAEPFLRRARRARIELLD